MFLRIVRLLICVALATPAAAQSTTPNIAGVWVLNPALTQRPQEIGFSNDWAQAGGDQGSRSGGGGSGGGDRGRRGGSGSGGAAAAPLFSRESADDSTRKVQLTGEARTPPDHITIVQKDTAISIADDQGHSRTFHPDGRVEELAIGTVALPTRSQWDSGSFIVLFDVEAGRQLRYTFTPTENPKRLLVDIRFLERGHDGDEVKLTYEPPDEHERTVLSGTTAAPGLPPPDAPAAPGAGAGAPPSAPATAPAASAPAARPAVLPPGSELRGLTVIGTQVEDLSAQAVACGLDQNKIKTSIAGILSAAGFKSQPYGNEESYVLVSVVTSRLSDGTCVSRYDASLMAQADATFPYVKGLVMVEVPLMREGGMAGGSPTVHSKAIMDALAKSVNTFITQVKAANK